MKKLLIIVFTLFIAGNIHAQTQFFGKVKIEFEKTLNVHAIYKELDPQWYDQIKERLPQTAITYHEFIGDSTRSVFKPGKDAAIDPRSWYRPVADKNVIFTDFKSGKSISQKPVYEEIFLIEDSLLKIKWKITPDTRIIAGYECRKAVGILDDSIAIFAFYSDEFIINGGPEGIHGLPGMILGMGIPRLHATWFATKVEVFDVNMKAVVPATKGKKVSRSDMLQSLDKIMRQWGKYGSKMIINFAI
ncbi:MAG: GLPGLI family protein [Bacteroidota bacterium]|nr:GLPGLI family protein [Bacteroidota bacterium]